MESGVSVLLTATVKRFSSLKLRRSVMGKSNGKWPPEWLPTGWPFNQTVHR
jgi:hypothetical protein